MAGEMSSHEMQVTQAALAGVKRKITAQDLRTAKAVLSGVKSKIDQRKN
jgi:fructose-specific phosphotransferase system component IIB